MKVSSLVSTVVGLAVLLRYPPRRTARGLSQSAEIAILVGGAAAIAAAILLVVGPYVAGKLPK